MVESLVLMLDNIFQQSEHELLQTLKELMIYVIFLRYILCYCVYLTALVLEMSQK